VLFGRQRWRAQVPRFKARIRLIELGPVAASSTARDSMSVMAFQTTRRLEQLELI